MSSYYKLIERVTETEEGVVTAHYCSTIHAQGAWNPHEQHMGPASGIMAAELERFSPRADMRIGRISFDVFGLISEGEFSITTRVIRPGKTIELLEAEMQANGRVCVVARAWRMQIQESAEIAALEDQPVLHPDSLKHWDGMQHWPGAYVKSLEVKADANHRAGKGIVWLRNGKEMIEGQATSDFVRLIGMVDTANGVAARQGKEITWGFPNLDLQIHMYRYPTGKWLGLETLQQYGADGIGITSAILHDTQGPFGRSEQILTLRKI